jgi:hypothetical protein
LADSKGKYIEREVITEHCLKVKSIWKKRCKIQDCINWEKNNLTTIFDATEKYTFYSVHCYNHVNKPGFSFKKWVTGAKDVR